MTIPIWITAIIIPLAVGSLSGLVTTIYKDNREDKRRKDDLQRAKAETKRHAEEALRERQLSAVTDFIEFVRDEETNLHTDYRDTVTAHIATPQDAIKKANVQIERNARFLRNLIKAWDLLDLKILDVEVRVTVRNLEIAISKMATTLGNQMKTSQTEIGRIPVLSFTGEFFQRLDELKQVSRTRLTSPGSKANESEKTSKGMFT